MDRLQAMQKMQMNEQRMKEVQNYQKYLFDCMRSFSEDDGAVTQTVYLLQAPLDAKGYELLVAAGKKWGRAWKVLGFDGPDVYVANPLIAHLLLPQDLDSCEELHNRLKQFENTIYYVLGPETLYLGEPQNEDSGHTLDYTWTCDGGCLGKTNGTSCVCGPSWKDG